MVDTEYKAPQSAVDTDFDWHWPDGSRVTRGPRYAYDIETDGLLPPEGTVKNLWCLVYADLDTGEVFSGCDHPDYVSPTGATVVDLKTAKAAMGRAEIGFGHNILSYDDRVMAHLDPTYKGPAKSIDTFLLAKLVWPVDKLKDLDFPRWRNGTLPGKLIGAHSLEAWGYRMGEMKGEYSATVKEWSKKLKSGEVSMEQVPKDLHVLLCDDGTLDPWKAWNAPMQAYCEQDVRVTVRLLKLIMEHLKGTGKASNGHVWPARVVDLEHRIWQHMIDQQVTGLGFDKPQAVELAGRLKNRQAQLDKQLKKFFGSWWEASDIIRPAKETSRIALDGNGYPFKDVTIPRVSEKTGKDLAPYIGPPKAHYHPDHPFVNIVRVSFNPKSRKHLGDRLQAIYGWQPQEWVGQENEDGEKTTAKVDETILKQIDASILPEATRELILEYFVVSKTLGQLADGRKAWIALCSEIDQRLHGRVDTLGAVSGRCAHRDPNLAQVPAVSIKEIKDDDGKVVSKEFVLGWKGGFGYECRTLMSPGIRKRDGSPGFDSQVGTDASGLELRMLGHYLHPFDDGAFAKRVSTPGLDIHGENAKLTGLTRAETKTVTYAFLYGAGPAKLGVGVGVSPDLIDHYADSTAAKSYLSFMRKITKDQNLEYNRQTLAWIGRGAEVSKKFQEGIEGLRDMKNAIKEDASKGYIEGLDGRKLYIRKPHAALNQLLQGGGAIICKAWVMEMDDILRSQGLVPGVDYAQMGFIHDEAQFETMSELCQVLADASSEGMRRVGEKYGVKCDLATESKFGKNWADCH